jgi:lysophospholipid acyltransferase (LPLAT)-like uncharacterized protein
MDRREVKFRAAGLLGRGLLGSYFSTVRLNKEGADNYEQFRSRGEPVLFAFWHGHLLPLVYFHRNEGVVVLVSDHSDGEYIARVILRHGFEVARGSSTRGGVKGLKGILRAAREGRDLGITPDGPTGPRQVVKLGTVVAAQLTGLPIIPVSVGANRAWHVRSWDRFMVPKPFSTLRIRYGTPVCVPRRAEEPALKELARRLEEELKAAALELNPQEARIREELNAPR